MFTKEGYSWTPASGLHSGVPSIGVVQPTKLNATSGSGHVYDAIVIGSGYAGLTASRDLTTQGKRTLLVEARDRLGGRTWHATVDGFNYEMGGTWVHWHMPHVYREISYYGMQDDWFVTRETGHKEDYTTFTFYGGQRNVTREVEEEVIGGVWRKFCNLDGEDLQDTWRYTFGTHQSPQLMAKWDAMTCQDRLDQIRSELTGEEIGALESFIHQMGGSTLDKMGLLNALHWWILGSHKPTGLNAIGLYTRLRSGQSALHRRMFEHAVSTGRLSYTFSTPVSRIEQSTDGIVSVTVRDGTTYYAKSVICTVPLNVLPSIEFQPPLPKDKKEGILNGQSVNKCNKVHIDLAGPEWQSWAGNASPGKGLIAAIGDGITPTNNSHVVTFGPDPETPLGIKLGNVETIKEAVLHMLPEGKANEADIRRIVYHDWNEDEFANGTWAYLPCNFVTKYLAALQRPHGNVLFASGDYSDGWRGWIDGAVQIGMQAAKQVIEAQAKKTPLKKLAAPFSGNL